MACWINTLATKGDDMAPQENEQNPMSLENLPAYLKSLKEKGSTGDCLVDMGRIEEPKKMPKKWLWTQRILFTLAICMIAGTTGLITYDLASRQELTVVVNLNNDANPAQAIPEMVADSGGTVLAVKQHDSTSSYEVKVSTRKSRKALLEWLNKNKNVKEVKFKETK